MNSSFPLLRRTLRCVSLRWVLLVLLLLGQQSALVHALGHASGHAQERVAGLSGHDHAHEHAYDEHGYGHAAEQGCHDESGGSTHTGQCAFDLLYSELLCYWHAGDSLHVAAAAAVLHAVTAVRSRSAATCVPYDSCAPPLFS